MSIAHVRCLLLTLEYVQVHSLPVSFSVVWLSVACCLLSRSFISIQPWSHVSVSVPINLLLLPTSIANHHHPHHFYLSGLLSSFAKELLALLPTNVFSCCSSLLTARPLRCLLVLQSCSLVSRLYCMCCASIVYALPLHTEIYFLLGPQRCGGAWTLILPVDGRCCQLEDRRPVLPVSACRAVPESRLWSGPFLPCKETRKRTMLHARSSALGWLCLR